MRKKNICEECKKIWGKKSKLKKRNDEKRKRVIGRLEIKEKSIKSEGFVIERKGSKVEKRIEEKEKRKRNMIGRGKKKKCLERIGMRKRMRENRILKSIEWFELKNVEIEGKKKIKKKREGSIRIKRRFLKKSKLKEGKEDIRIGIKKGKKNGIEDEVRRNVKIEIMKKGKNLKVNVEEKKDNEIKMLWKDLGFGKKVIKRRKKNWEKGGEGEEKEERSRGYEKRDK